MKKYYCTEYSEQKCQKDCDELRNKLLYLD